METAATILHADLDAFYASVEQLLDPSLRGKPIAVGGGVVLAASYEAKALGVHSGMAGRRARHLCPQLIFVGGHFKEYQRLGDAAIAVLNDFTPLVERISIDEAFADVAGCAHLFANGDGARPFCRSSLGHSFDHTRCADLSDVDPCGISEQLVRTVLADYPDDTTISLLAISVSHLEEHADLQLEFPLGLEDERLRPGSRLGLARLKADRAVDNIRERFGWQAIGYGSVALELSRAVPDEFRELAEKNL